MVSANSDRFENGSFCSEAIYWEKILKTNKQQQTMKWITCIAFLTISLNDCIADQNKAFRERVEIYSSKYVHCSFNYIHLNFNLQIQCSNWLYHNHHKITNIHTCHLWIESKIKKWLEFFKCLIAANLWTKWRLCFFRNCLFLFVSVDFWFTLWNQFLNIFHKQSITNLNHNPAGCWINFNFQRIKKKTERVKRTNW